MRNSRNNCPTGNKFVAVVAKSAAGCARCGPACAIHAVQRERYLFKMLRDDPKYLLGL